jgi:hypothetical protein
MNASMDRALIGVSTARNARPRAEQQQPNAMRRAVPAAARKSGILTICVLDQVTTSMCGFHGLPD